MYIQVFALGPSGVQKEKIEAEHIFVLDKGAKIIERYCKNTLHALHKGCVKRILKVRLELGSSQSHVIHVSDPWDKVNNFCFHFYAQNSLFLDETGNDFFTSPKSPMPVTLEFLELKMVLFKIVKNLDGSTVRLVVKATFGWLSFLVTL